MTRPEAIQVLRNYVDHIATTWNSTHEGRQYLQTFQEAVDSLDERAGLLPLPVVPIPHDPLAFERQKYEQGGEEITSFAVTNDHIISVVKFTKKRYKTFQYVRSAQTNLWATKILADEKDTVGALASLKTVMPINTIN